MTALPLNHWLPWLIFSIALTGCGVAQTLPAPTPTIILPPTLVSISTPQPTRTRMPPTTTTTRTSTLPPAPSITPTYGPTETPWPSPTFGPTPTPENFLTQVADCHNAAITTMEITGCIILQQRGYEKLLDKLVLEVKRLYPEQGPGLDKVQENWKVFVKADCDWNYDLYSDGTMRSIIGASCYVANYKDRINALSWVLCDDGPNCQARKEYLKWGIEK